MIPHSIISAMQQYNMNQKQNQSAFGGTVGMEAASKALQDHTAQGYGSQQAYCSTPKTEKAISPTHEKLDQLSYGITQIDAITSMVESKFDPILKPTLTADSDKPEGRVPAYQSQLCSSLDDAITRLGKISARLSSIMDRSDV